jgi:hypothetical protein
LAANAPPLESGVGFAAGGDPSISGDVGQPFVGGGVSPPVHSTGPALGTVNYYGEYMLGPTTIYVVTDGAGAFWLVVAHGGDVSGGVPPSPIVADGDQLSNTWNFDNTCFAGGTMLATPEGERAVETLAIGDLVNTAHNGPRKVVWIGSGKVQAERGRRGPTTPVVVRKGALADNVPNRDLHITKAHGLYIDDVIIPVEFLVNHRTILWNDQAQEVDIYHVELDTHDVLIANGAPAESYRDDGNRESFQNANSGWHLPPKPPCAPVLTGGPVVDAAWRRFLDRSGPRAVPALIDDPDLHLIVDGQRIDPRERKGRTYVFRLPSAPNSVIVASRAAEPSELGTTRDPRLLGVALRHIEIQQGARYMRLNANDDRLTAGFHDYEPADKLRWTNGGAALPIEAFVRFDTGAEVMVHLGGATHYPAGQISVGRAAGMGFVTTGPRLMPMALASRSPDWKRGRPREMPVPRFGSMSLRVKKRPDDMRIDA